MKNPVPKVAAIHDLSGFGRASLTVVTPILSSMGVQVCPIPTAVLSTHSKFPDFHFIDLTDHMQPIMDHWKELSLEFEGIYSGFLGSARQIEIVARFIDDFRKEDQVVVVDPVLGDNGQLYSVFDKEMVENMRSLISHAEIITPNLTEAAFLLDEPYHEDVTEAEIKDWMQRLAAFGPQKVIVTSVPVEGQKNKTSVLAFNKKDNRIWKVSCDYFPANYPGTGDAFASVLVGALLQGDSLPLALDRAVHFISYGVRATFGYDYDTRQGILLERILHSLDAPVQISSYQLLNNE